MKILKIDKMRNCGFFEDFKWPEGLESFERVNVIYGPNGSGKSSFSRAFEELLDADPEDSDEKEFTFTVSDGSGKEWPFSSKRAGDFADRVFVYSDSYVEKGHLFRSDPTLESVLTVGERTVEEERELEEILKKLNDKEGELKGDIDRKKKMEKELNRIYSSVSDLVVNANAAAGGRWKSKNAYNVTKVREAFEERFPRWIELTEEQLREKTSLINMPKMDLLNIPLGDFGGDYFSIERLESLLLESPVSKMLDTLEKYPEASRWVQDGLELHSGVEECIFCGGALTEARKGDIAQHFSRAVEELQENLQSAIDQMVAIKTQYLDMLNALPDSRLLTKQLQSSFETARDVVESDVKSFQAAVDENILIAKRKMENVLAVVENAVVKFPAVDLSRIALIIVEHNQLVNNRDRLVGGAAKQIEEHYLKVNLKNVLRLKDGITECEESIRELGDVIGRLETRHAALVNREGDPLPAAGTMTARVAEILGRSELEFETISDGKRYRVMRNGKPASDLSTGERSVIMLVYFLEEVSSYCNQGSPIVVIDDPVSSMDSNVFMGISTYIWSKMINRPEVDQLFLLTHNYELFRQWDIQLEAVKKYVEHRLYELCAEYRNHGGEKARRMPNLQAWPPSHSSRKKVRSSYHHMFMSVAAAKRKLEIDDSLDNRMDAQLLFPNVIRRLLETFLAFRYPGEVGNLTKAMSEAEHRLKESGYKGDVDALRLRLTRYAHVYSHSETPGSGAIVQPEEIRTAMAAVFTFMDVLDPDHFKGMCEALDLAREDLIRGPKGWRTDIKVSSAS
ncbi:MAG: AAA family ATPase [Schaalia turicensis]